MGNGHYMVKGNIRIVSATLLVLIACAGVFLAVMFLPNWVAERRARAFCDEIPIGSDISSATARANSRKILWGSHDFYTFYFPGLILDKAVCEVSVTQEGKVKAKSASLEVD
jgi:hypothetical protein